MTVTKGSHHEFSSHHQGAVILKHVNGVTWGRYRPVPVVVTDEPRLPDDVMCCDVAWCGVMCDVMTKPNFC